jgi:hypothetical protein
MINVAHKTFAQKVQEILPVILPDILTNMNISQIIFSSTEPINPIINTIWVDTS